MYVNIYIYICTPDPRFVLPSLAAAGGTARRSGLDSGLATNKKKAALLAGSRWGLTYQRPGPGGMQFAFGFKDVFGSKGYEARQNELLGLRLLCCMVAGF